MVSAEWFVGDEASWRRGGGGGGGSGSGGGAHLFQLIEKVNTSFYFVFKHRTDGRADGRADGRTGGL